MNNPILQLGETKNLKLLLTQNNIGVPGLSPTVEIRRQTDWYYIDFDTDTFVTLGGTLEDPMVEDTDTTGLYTYDFTPSTYDETAAEIYTVFYRNDSTTHGVFDYDELNYQDSSSLDTILADSELLRKLLTNKTVLRKLDTYEFEQEYYDDDATSIIRTDDITKVADEETRTPRA